LLATIFRSSLHAVDIAVNSWMPTIQSGVFTVFAAGIDVYFDTNYLVLYAVIIAAVFFVRHQKQKGLLVVGALAGAALFVSIVKRIELVPRPSNALLLKPGYSFPSGHVAGIIVLAGVLAFFALRYWQGTRAKVGIVCGYCAMVGLISFDRVYLNTHWFSDVLASLLLGAAWLVFVILLYRWLEQRGSFQGRRFNAVANWLYVGAAVLAVLVLLSGAVV
jgi:membrane-associated phospholipid phosphatase